MGDVLPHHTTAAVHTPRVGRQAYRLRCIGHLAPIRAHGGFNLYRVVFFVPRGLTVHHLELTQVLLYW